MEEGNEITKNIYQLKLHEVWEQEMRWGNRLRVTRVPGGWIYNSIYRDRDGKDTHWPPIFVPFNKEFIKSK